LRPPRRCRSSRPWSISGLSDCTRSGKRTAKAALRIAVELAQEKLISKEEAVTRVDPAALDQLLVDVASRARSFDAATDPGNQCCHGPRSGTYTARSVSNVTEAAMPSSRDIFKNIQRNSKGLSNYYINSQTPFPANSNQYRFNNNYKAIKSCRTFSRHSKAANGPTLIKWRPHCSCRLPLAGRDRFLSSAHSARPLEKRAPRAPRACMSRASGFPAFRRHRC